MHKIVIVGGGGHALVLRETIELLKVHVVIGVVLDDAHYDSVRPELVDLPRFRMSEVGGLARQGIRGAAVGIGDNRARAAASARLRANGLEIVAARHPSAIVSPSAVLGEGSVIMAGVAISTLARIGRDTIINTSASVDHDCVIGDAAHVSPGVHLAGSVRIGNLAWIGVGAVISNNLEVGAGSIIGAGSVVVRNIPAGVVAYGVPAKVVRTVAAVTDHHPSTDSKV